MQLPVVQQYIEYIFLLIISHCKCSEIIPSQIGTTKLNRALLLISADELKVAPSTWKQAHLSTVLTKSNKIGGPQVSKLSLVLQMLEVRLELLSQW